MPLVCKQGRLAGAPQSSGLAEGHSACFGSLSWEPKKGTECRPPTWVCTLLTVALAENSSAFEDHVPSRIEIRTGAGAVESKQR